MMIIPNKLRAIRKQRGYSQCDVARMIQRSPQSISHYETPGRRALSVDVLLQILKALGTTSREFFTDIDDAATLAARPAPRARDRKYCDCEFHVCSNAAELKSTLCEQCNQSCRRSARP